MAKVNTVVVHFYSHDLNSRKLYAETEKSPKMAWLLSAKTNVCGKCSSLHFRCRNRNLVDLYSTLMIFLVFCQVKM